jgi:hypothetical protein
MPLHDCIPIYEPGEAWSDETLAQCFLSGKPVRKVQLYGLLALRADRHPAFLALLQAEATASENREAVFFGFIKIAWLPVLAVLEHGTDAQRAHLAGWIGEWRAEERIRLLDYLRRETDLLVWFPPS